MKKQIFINKTDDVKKKLIQKNLKTPPVPCCRTADFLHDLYYRGKQSPSIVMDMSIRHKPGTGGGCDPEW